MPDPRRGFPLLTTSASATRSALSRSPAAARTRVRWSMAVLAFLATTINYVDRANLGVAAPFIQRELHLTGRQTGWILGAFFWTYAAFQLPSGWVVDRLGVRLVYAGAVVWWSLFTGATAVARGFASLMGYRLLLGA